MIINVTVNTISAINTFLHYYFQVQFSETFRENFIFANRIDDVVWKWHTAKNLTFQAALRNQNDESNRCSCSRRRME